MIITWALTIAAFVIIWVEIRGWSQVRRWIMHVTTTTCFVRAKITVSLLLILFQVNNPHAILGTITTLICFFQPIGAFFRPHPGSKRRPLFNWTHWLGGNTAHIMAFVTIFFSVKLGKAELPEWMEWILVAFVIFHVISHLLLTVRLPDRRLIYWFVKFHFHSSQIHTPYHFCQKKTLACVSDRKGTQRISAFPMTDINHSRSQILASAKQDEVVSSLFSFHCDWFDFESL